MPGDDILRVRVLTNKSAISARDAGLLRRELWDRQTCAFRSFSLSKRQTSSVDENDERNDKETSPRSGNFAEERRDLSHREITKHNVRERRRASSPDSAFIVAAIFSAIRLVWSTLGAYASPDASAKASVRATGVRCALLRSAPLRARVSWYLGAHASGEPRSHIA
ncbi:hypothetical protein ALC53_08167 [Atta colombica]|uniref:Uncharacterized protein n=1 Tax=Atta colombica TaxID=520822 RepID=A0A195BB31_9HYME|nr:hypothetical protein ALC53_08167 [Atta colombica]